MPAWPKLSLPGFALAKSIRSFTVLKRELAGTTSTCGPETTLVTGTKSFSGS